MADDAGFAVAITIREHLLNDALRVAYAGSGFPRTLATAALGGLPGGPPDSNLDVFLGPPAVACHANNTLTITLEMWGQLTVTMNGVDEAAEIDGRLAVDITPAFGIVSITSPDGTKTNHLEMDPSGSTVSVSPATGWDFTVISQTGFTPDADGYLRSVAFVGRLQEAIRLAISAGLVSLPSIDVSFLGSIANAVDMKAESRIRQGVILIGLNVDSDPDNPIIGNIDALVDFAQDNGIAAVTSAQAVPVLLRDVQAKLVEGASKQGATLHVPVSIVPDSGRFLISGSASNSDGTANFSFSIIPTLFAFRPGKVFTYMPRPLHVNRRSWPALGFTAADVYVDVDPAGWVVVLTELLSNINPLIPQIVQSMIDSIASEFKAEVRNANLFTPIPRVQRLPPSGPGGASVRIELAQYEITPDGTYAGIKVTPEPLPGVLIGPVSIPADLRSSKLGYSVRMPLGVAADDPQLRIRWTVIDPGSGTVLQSDDGFAAGREAFAFAPDALLPGTSHLRVAVRVYRALGPSIIDFLNDGISLTITGPLAPGTFVRWRYEVKNMQVQFDGQANDWVYTGDLVVKRHSRLHRTDARHCSFFDAQSRYTGEVDVLDELPFPVEDIELNRYQLCDYCFFGGPAGLRAAL